MAGPRASVVVVLPLLALLAGCELAEGDIGQVAATPQSVTPLAIPPASVALETRTGFLDGSPLLRRADTDTTVTAHWVAGRNQFAVVLFGSSSTCPAIPISTARVDEATVSVTFVPFHSENPVHACTADASPIAYFFATPPSLAEGDVTAAVTFDDSGRSNTERVRIEP